MKLQRLAVIEFDPFPKAFDIFPITLDGVILQAFPYKPEAHPNYLFVVATIELKSRPELTPENAVLIPENTRLQAEDAIRKIADIIAVMEQTSRVITSPTPCAVFVPETRKELEWLSSTRGIYTTLNNRGGVRSPQRIDIKKHLADLEDRWNGVSLLAESFGHGHSAGKFHEFIRLFELAFSMPFGQLGSPLSRFLGDTALGYTEDEVMDWVRLRDPSVHADLRRQSYFTLDATIRPVVYRVEQAAYDVLFNKVEWHTPAITRRETWRPTAGTSNKDSDIFVMRGEEMNITFELRDDFGTFGRNLNAFIGKPPAGVWLKQYSPEED